MDLLSVQIIKIVNFKNPRWQTAVILKTGKSPYVLSRSTDFDEIWHSHAHSLPGRPGRSPDRIPGHRPGRDLSLDIDSSPDRNPRRSPTLSSGLDSDPGRSR